MPIKFGREKFYGCEWFTTNVLIHSIGGSVRQLTGLEHSLLTHISALPVVWWRKYIVFMGSLLSSRVIPSISVIRREVYTKSVQYIKGAVVNQRYMCTWKRGSPSNPFLNVRSITDINGIWVTDMLYQLTGYRFCRLVTGKNFHLRPNLYQL